MLLLRSASATESSRNVEICQKNKFSMFLQVLLKPHNSALKQLYPMQITICAGHFEVGPNSQMYLNLFFRGLGP